MKKSEETNPEYVAKELERKINQCIEESAVLCAKGDTKLALEKAKEGVKREKALAKHRETTGTADTSNLDLVYSTYFNLANMYEIITIFIVDITSQVSPKWVISRCVRYLQYYCEKQAIHSRSSHESEYGKYLL